MSDVPTVTVAFSEREWATIDQVARRQNVAPVAVVRACVQRVLGDAPSPDAVIRREKPVPQPRICPGCNQAVLVKKHPHGPGRYPTLCEECR